jgi:hypothetical protein
VLAKNCCCLLSAKIARRALNSPATNEARGAYVATAPIQAGSISGTLMDPAGAVLRGAQVSIPEKGMTVLTDEQGRFFFSGLEPGNYMISVSYIGFQTLTER